MSHDSKPAIILTGFGPFPGVIKNPTAELVDLIKSDPPQGFVKGKVSEVSAVGVLQTLASLQKTLSTIEKDRPVILAHLGVATMYDKFHLERFGWNVCDFGGHGDMRSWHPHNQVIVAKNAHLRHHYETRFDLNLLKEQLNSVGMQAEISEDPGKYLCGFLYYNSLYLSRKIDRLFVLFVHCPSIQSIELKDQVKFIRSLLECLQEQIVTGKVSQSLIEHKH